MNDIIIKPDEFPEHLIDDLKNIPRPIGNRGGRDKKLYKDIVCAFDIETTTISEISQSFMYVWQFQFGLNITVIGRTWEQFILFIETLKEHLRSSEYLVVYVHNLAFEFQFLAGIYDFSPDEVFAVKARRPLKVEMYNHIEFRCSYLHSNMSLDKFLKNVGATTLKESGEEFDYNKRRYPWTALSTKELKYIVHDVKGLVEAIYIELEKDNDTLYTIPLTSTGYVRREFKKAMQTTKKGYVQEMFPDYELYKALREAFRGGDTHANRWYVGEILDNVKSADRSSSYPDEQVNGEYPITPFAKLEHVSRETCERKIYKRHQPLVMRIALSNVKMRDEYFPNPYLPRAKCRSVKNPKYDNGRILEAEYLEITVTDIDYKIINEIYDFDMSPIDVWLSHYGKLPEPALNLIRKLYTDKTSLKGIVEQEYYYMKSKNKINSVYGMTAQDPVKISDLYCDGEFVLEDDDMTDEQRVILEKTKLSKEERKAFIPYQWGVWCTALARYDLYKGVRLVYNQDGYPIYWDTDSVKYLKDVDWNVYNAEQIKKSTSNHAYADDINNIRHYMGVFEQEDTYNQFITWGAKKYADTKNGKLEITIAGVPKKGGAKELEKAGGLEALRPGFIFIDSGKLESVYNDENYGTYQVEGRTIQITRNVTLRPTTYTLSISDDFDELLDEINYNKALTILRKSGKI